MNLRNIANGLTSAINPNIAATVRICTGYAIGANLRGGPSYAKPAPLTVQVQALSKKDVEHLDSLNISNATRSVYVNIQLTAMDREKQTGGDLLQFEGATWLVVAVLEGWTTAGWCRVAVTKQINNA